MNKEELKNLNKREKEDAFLVACFDSDIETVKYLTSGHDFPCVNIFCSDKNDVQNKEGVSLEYAAENGSLEIVQYLISLPKEKGNGQSLYQQKTYQAFNSAYINRHMDIVYFFIFEKEVKETIVNNYIHKDKKKYKELKELFSKREMIKNLDNKLKPQNLEIKDKSKKVKI